MKKTWYLPRKKQKHLIIIILVLITILYYFGVFTHLFEKDFFTEFHYPYDGDIEELVQQLRHNDTPTIAPINSFNYKYTINCKNKCHQVHSLRLVYLIKSAPGNQRKRIAIRSSWGFQRRFSDVEIRTVFLIGQVNNEQLQETIKKESLKFEDIIQGNFTDTYFNNTYKTMMGFHWIVNYCSNSRYYMFVDDDYYVSTKNVLRFLRHPTNYPKYLKEPKIDTDLLFQRHYLQAVDYDLDDNVRLYTGYTFQSPPHRHYISKWYISLDEYPYHLWPPYVNAGAYVLSRDALIDMYYASFYTKFFKFDDIYVGLLAFKCKIYPFHSEEFNFYKKTYYPKDYQFTIASHGYEDPDELLQVWTEQKILGNA